MSSKPRRSSVSRPRRSSVAKEEEKPKKRSAVHASTTGGGDDEEEPEEPGPGQLFVKFLVMEDLLDKLKLLNYESEFIKELNMKPIHRHYFAMSTNPGEQFYLFTNLAAWLVRLTGRKFEPPQEYDDPNSTITNVIDALRSMRINSDFPPSKLKQGSGEQVVFVLDKLTDEALKSTNFQWEKPVPIVEEQEEEVDVGDDMELTLEKVEEDLINDGPSSDEEDEDNILNLEDLSNIPAAGMVMEKPEEILESKTNADEWNLEVQRVLPQLKVTIRTDGRDWRSHMDQMHQLDSTMNESLSGTKGQLDKLHSEISRTLEKIHSREKYLNNQLEGPLMEFRALQDQLAQVQEQYRTLANKANEKKQLQLQLTSRLNEVKREMEERSSSMTDGTPLVKIRKALARVKQDLAAMDVRLGVVEHSLLQAKLRDRGSYRQEMIPSANTAIIVPVGLY